MSQSVIQVRRAETVDAKSFADLVSATLTERFDAVFAGDELAQLAHTYQDRLPGHAYYVAESDGRLMGYAMTDRGGAGHRHPVVIERLYIRHDADGQPAEYTKGVATALVDAIIADSEATLEPEASEGIEQALTVLGRWGFVDMYALRVCLTSPSSNGRLHSDGMLEW